jgi:signal transduction histidine kinase
VVLAAAYIAISGFAARAMAGADVETLERIELTKGIGFVLVTGLMAFAASRALLGKLARPRNALAAAHVALVQAEAQATATLLAATLAHDLKNILIVLQVGVDELEGSAAPDPSRDELVDDMRDALARVSALAERLAKAGKGVAQDDAEPTDLDRLVRHAVAAAKLHPAVRTCEFEEALEPVRATVKKAVVEHLVGNLVLNAAEAGGHGCHIRVSLASEPEGGARLEVHDDGPGVPADLHEQIFAPFHTTKESGTGLGLLSVRLGAALHGGTVSVESSPLGGACFRVTLRDAVVELDEEWVGDWAFRTGHG